ncbi:hypothetical protein BESB_061890 [Besnoitia besnoiti]|uniref:Uncharacterized protein n=1 Tax=Besnoitia besnoiti TaxID=94643 RepID=A0A2A9MIT8_BESBE|nr:hypothetical protein BESB_061890 [Besnoitia besnoiti]PFH35302.1 hypothetical protein BESB_061890 [Besnoitia besnoiti]
MVAARAPPRFALGRILGAAGLSFLGGWHCRQTLAEASRPFPAASPASPVPPQEPAAPPSSSPSSSPPSPPFSSSSSPFPSERGLLVTRRLVVPSSELHAFAGVLNALAAFNTRQSGFLSHSIYTREVFSTDAAVPPAPDPVALEVLMFEEWLNPLAARAALKSPEMKRHLEESRKCGWDLRGEVWVGLAGRDARGL